MVTGDKPVRVAVDAMGGDHAPGEVVAGAVEAAREGNVQVILVGDLDRVRLELAKHDAEGVPVAAFPSEGVVLENEQPALALRQKPRASILVATGLVNDGQADAVVTLGSTGAAMAAAVVTLGVIEGIERPALGGPIAGFAPHTMVIDLGTNVDCRPSQLRSFAVIGNVFARQFWGIESPRVALLSVGAESGKGNRQVKEATELIANSGLNFIGNVEANDLPYDRADVVVCDGFVGNIAMKLTEGLGSATADLVKERLNARLPKAELTALTDEIYNISNITETYGGGPIFGVDGVSVVGHGRGDAESVRRAISTARRVVEVGFVTTLNDELAILRDKIGA